jgi:hypothetical protein
MAKLISKLAITAVVAIGAVAASAQDFDRRCSAATIEGDYAFRVSGELFTPAGVINRDGIALTHFDGDHLLTQVDYVLADGIPTPGPKDANGFNTNEAGTYTVHENCTGEAEIDFPVPPGGTSGAVIKFLFVISDNGNQLNTIVTSITPPNSSNPVPANIHSDAVRVRNRPLN